MKYLFWLFLGLMVFSPLMGCGPTSGSTQLPISEEPSGDDNEPENKPRERGDD